MRLTVEQVPATFCNSGVAVAYAATVWQGVWSVARNALPPAATIRYAPADPFGPNSLAHELGHVLLAVVRGAVPLRCLDPLAAQDAHWPEECAAWAIGRRLTRRALWAGLDDARVAACLASYTVPEWARDPRIPEEHALTRELVAWLAEPGTAEDA